MAFRWWRQRFRSAKATFVPSGFDSVGIQSASHCFAGECLVEPPARVDGLVADGEIGAFTYVQSGAVIQWATVGRFCSIARNVTIGAGEHETDWLSTHPFVFESGDVAAGLSGVFPEYLGWLGSKPSRTMRENKRAVIGNDVWIGHGAFIRRGVTVGDGAVIGAHAVVTRDVAPYEIVAGIPSRTIRSRFEPKIVARLIALQWWNFDLSPLTDRIDYSRPEQAIPLIEEAISAGSLKPMAPRRVRISGGRFSQQ